MRILLPVDGSGHALTAVHHAMRLAAEGLNASFVLANVQEPATLYERVVARDALQIEEVSDSAAAHSLAPAEALLRGAGVEYASEAGQGDPATELLSMIDRFGCDAVVMGARGMAAIEMSALGSVASALMQQAGVPVTIVKGSTDLAAATEFKRLD